MSDKVKISSVRKDVRIRFVQGCGLQGMSSTGLLEHNDVKSVEIDGGFLVVGISGESCIMYSVNAIESVHVTETPCIKTVETEKTVTVWNPEMRGKPGQFSKVTEEEAGKMPHGHDAGPIPVYTRYGFGSEWIYCRYCGKHLGVA